MLVTDIPLYDLIYNPSFAGTYLMQDGMHVKKIILYAPIYNTSFAGNSLMQAHMREQNIVE